MATGSAEEWQRLTRLYAEMSDEELIELSAGFADLTQVAQQVLRDELRRRGLPDPQTQPKNVPENRPAFSGWGRTPKAQDDAGQDLPHEYTWKTLLCECVDREHAWQIAELLKRADIESWIEPPGESLDVTGPRVMVAADQLEEARALSAGPIPQDIVDQSRIRPEDFQPPSCPKCGASDPLLLGVEPANAWRCENCGADWTDSLAFKGNEPDRAR